MSTKVHMGKCGVTMHSHGGAERWHWGWTAHEGDLHGANKAGSPTNYEIFNAAQKREYLESLKGKSFQVRVNTYVSDPKRVVVKRATSAAKLKAEAEASKKAADKAAREARAAKKAAALQPVA